MNTLQQNFVEQYKTSYTNWISFNFEHIWKIEKFKNTMNENYFSIYSSVFSVDDHDLKFQLHFESAKETNEKCLGLFFYCFIGETVISDVPIICNFGFIDIENNFKKIKAFQNIYKSSIGRGYSKFATYDILNDPSNKLFHENEHLHISVKGTVNYVKANEFILRQKKLLNSGKNSDISIVVENIKMPAHKTILLAHSPVFEAMFSYNDTKEAQEHKIDIIDVSAKVFAKFLLFIYTGIKPRTDFKEVLIVSEKYQVNELKYYCENEIALSFNNENVTEIYLFANLHNAQQLKEKSLDFIASNFSEIVKTKNWEQFCENASSEEIVTVTRAVGKMKISKNE